jgi:hypothetical protein
MYINRLSLLHIYAMLCFILLTSQSYAQTNPSQVPSPYLTDSNYKITPSVAIANLRKGDYTWIQEYPLSTDDITPFESSYQLDVFSYYNVSNAFSDSQIDSLVKTDKYNRYPTTYSYQSTEFYKSIADDLKKRKLDYVFDSELKRTVFSQSSTYKELLNKLTQIKTHYLSDVFYFIGSDNGFSINEFIENFTTKNDNGSAVFKVNYDLKSKGFYVGITTVLPYHCLSSFSPKTIRGIEFKQLKTYKEYGLFQSPNSYKEYLFFPIDMDNGLEMENNRESVDMLLIFNVKGMGTSTFADKDFLNDNHGKACQVRLVKGGNLRIVVYNKKTDKVYFDKLYSAQ